MTKNNAEYDFTLLLDNREVTVDLENALFEAGCDDATISLRYGCVCVTFSREEADLASAILSAVRDVRKAGCSVRRVDSCNLVTQAEIASRVDLTRTAIYNYVTGKRGPGGFPPPACNIDEDERSTMWNWCEVAAWFHDNDMIRKEQLNDALALDLINSWLEIQRQKCRNPEQAARIFETLGSRDCSCP